MMTDEEFLISLASPYRPWSGLEPPVLAGRTHVIDLVVRRMEAVVHSGRPGPSPIVLTGERGVGKSAALAHLRGRAEELGLAIAEAHFTSTRASNLQSLAEGLALSAGHWDETPGASWAKVKESLPEFSISVDSGQVRRSALLDPAALTQGSLTDLITETAAAQVEQERRGLAIFVDEVHTGSADDLNALAVTAQNIISDTHAPVLLVMAGDPDTAAAFDRAGSGFAERFEYVPIGPLTREEALRALVQPSKDRHVTWTPAAAEKAVRNSDGDPWRAQQIGDACWTVAMEQGAPIFPGAIIDSALVDKALARVAEIVRERSRPYVSETKVEDFQDWDEHVLHDVFRDTGYALDSRLIAREQEAHEAGDERRADAWRAESFAVWRERRQVSAFDWEGQAAAILRWRARRDEVQSGAEPQVVEEQD